MANYPSLPISAAGVEIALATDRVLERASNGAARGRVFYTAPKRSFKFTHPALSSSDLATFETFFSANMAASFVFAYLGTNYTCIFAQDPAKRYVAGGWHDVQISLVEV